MNLLLKEYVLSGDGDEAERCLRDLEVPHFHHEFVYEVKNSIHYLFYLNLQVGTAWPYWETFRWDYFIHTVFNQKISGCERSFGLMLCSFLLPGSDLVEYVEMTLYLTLTSSRRPL